MKVTKEIEVTENHLNKAEVDCCVTADNYCATCLVAQAVQEEYIGEGVISVAYGGPRLYSTDGMSVLWDGQFTDDSFLPAGDLIHAFDDYMSDWNAARREGRQVPTDLRVRRLLPLKLIFSYESEGGSV